MLGFIQIHCQIVLGILKVVISIKDKRYEQIPMARDSMRKKNRKNLLLFFDDLFSEVVLGLCKFLA